MYAGTYVYMYACTVQLNLNVTLACESLKKFHDIFVSSTCTYHAMCYINSTHTVLCPLVPYHHQIQFMYTT